MDIAARSAGTSPEVADPSQKVPGEWSSALECSRQKRRVLFEFQRLVDRCFLNADASVKSDHGADGLLGESYTAHKGLADFAFADPLQCGDGLPPGGDGEAFAQGV